MIKRIGTDITKIDRFENLDLIKRFLSDFEYKQYESKNSNYERLSYAASRWSCKESIVKATGYLDLSFKSIEIRNDDTGRPIVYIEGIHRKDILISISHEAEYTTTVALLQSK